MIAIKRVDAFTFESTIKKAGGKLRTITAKGTDKNGQPMSLATVWERQ